MRFTDADEAILREVQAALPAPRSVTATIRFALKVARSYLRLRERAAGGTICARFPDGRIVQSSFNLDP